MVTSAGGHFLWCSPRVIAFQKPGNSGVSIELLKLNPCFLRQSPLSLAHENLDARPDAGAAAGNIGLQQFA
jgi:hypothetical protein